MFRLYCIHPVANKLAPHDMRTTCAKHGFLMHHCTGFLKAKPREIGRRPAPEQDAAGSSAHGDVEKLASGGHNS